jgi:hypothetical protein
MAISLPVIVCLLGAVPFFSLAIKLRNFKVPAEAPASRVGLSIEERQRKITIAMWLAFSCGCGMFGGAILLACLHAR